MKVALTTIALILAALPARAEEPSGVTAPIKHDWTGFYVGVTGGFAVSGDTGVDTITNGLDRDRTPEVDDASTLPSFGAQLGYDLQMDNFVLGVTGDIQSAD